MTCSVIAGWQGKRSMVGALHPGAPQRFRSRLSLPTPNVWIEPDRAGAHFREDRDSNRATIAIPTPSDALANSKPTRGVVGLDLSAATASTTLLDLGFDSLFLTQAALALQKKFGVNCVRQLLDELAPLALSRLLKRGTSAGTFRRRWRRPERERYSPLLIGDDPRTVSAVAERAFGRLRTLNAAAQRFHRTLQPRTGGSKAHTAKHRAHFADPRAVAASGRWKELVIPIVATRSAGARIWDLVAPNTSYDHGFGSRSLAISRRLSWRRFTADGSRHGIGASLAAGGRGRRAALRAGGWSAPLLQYGSEAVLAQSDARTATAGARLRSLPARIMGSMMKRSCAR